MKKISVLINKFVDIVKTSQLDVVGDGWSVGQTITDVLKLEDVITILQQAGKNTLVPKEVHKALVDKFFEVKQAESRNMTTKEQEDFVRNYSQ